MVGSDVVAGLTTWKDEPALRDLVTLAVVGRPGAPPVPLPPGWRAVTVPVAPVRRLEHRAAGAARAGGAGGRTGPRGGNPLHRAAGSVRYEEMSVRTTPTDSGTTQSLHPYAGRQTVPAGPAGAGPLDDPPAPVGDGDQLVDETAPPDAAAPPAPAAAPDPATTADLEPEPGRDPRIEGRRQLRAARKRRRRISIVCAVLIAVCMALTLLLVAIARAARPIPWW